MRLSKNQRIRYTRPTNIKYKVTVLPREEVPDFNYLRPTKRLAIVS